MALSGDPSTSQVKMGRLWFDLRAGIGVVSGTVLQLAYVQEQPLSPGNCTRKPYGFHQSVPLSVSDLKWSFD